MENVITEHDLKYSVKRKEMISFVTTGLCEDGSFGTNESEYKKEIPDFTEEAVHPGISSCPVPCDVPQIGTFPEFRGEIRDPGSLESPLLSNSPQVMKPETPHSSAGLVIKKEAGDLELTKEEPHFHLDDPKDLSTHKIVSEEELEMAQKMELGMVLLPDGEQSEDNFEISDTENDVVSSIPKDDLKPHLFKENVLLEMEEEDRLDEENDPPSIGRGNNREKRRKLDVNYKKCKFDPLQDTEWRDFDSVDESWFGQTPLFFFHLFFDTEMIKYICNQTAIYASEGSGIKLHVSEDEMKVYIGILITSGIMKPHSYTTYWNKSLRYDIVANAMARNRFEQLKRFLHFNNNANMKRKDHPGHDKLFKIRPILEALRRNCRNIPQEEHQAVVEQIIPTKPRYAFRQYNSQKASKCGYKVMSRVGRSGIIYNFELYTGRGSTINRSNELEVSSQFVMRLCEGVPRHKNYKIYFDKWFSSLELTKQLKDEGILCLSTVQIRRLKGCGLEDDSNLKKNGRGSLDYMVEQNSNCIVVKWYDNSAVHLLSSYAGIEPQDTCRRYDRKSKTYISVPRPFVVKEFNSCMSGVDLNDMLLELYRTDFRSRKWYMRIFFYCLDLSIVNAWLVYKRVCQKMNISKVMQLSDFRSDIGRGLIGNPETRKRGLPSSSSACPPKRRNLISKPAESLRFDNTQHIPECVPKKIRCKECITAHTRVRCMKCNVGLCLTANRNCFRSFHIK